ncbi:hypothetical protein MRBLMI12_000492 [Microbacterium sp. LMI12-1-1.1]|uniref:hypothetical protein n=1 Tax=Microbacterium sp. LMI12-1-1.1 TaxID=3135225 RepID=UPI00343786F5
MTRALWVDPGLMTGIALSYYDATTPYQLLQRWQIGRGIHGWIDWKLNVGIHLGIDELGYEKFILGQEEDAQLSGDPLAGVPIEGSIHEWGIVAGIPVMIQDRTHKGSLIGYPTPARSKAERQRVRFDWLEEHGLFEAGTGNDDSNDAITHGIVNLKIRHHVPTMRHFWPPRRRLDVVA